MTGTKRIPKVGGGRIPKRNLPEQGQRNLGRRLESVAQESIGKRKQNFGRYGKRVVKNKRKLKKYVQNQRREQKRGVWNRKGGGKGTRKEYTTQEKKKRLKKESEKNPGVSGRRAGQRR